jgi:hypothetical protein
VFIGSSDHLSRLPASEVAALNETATISVAEGSGLPNLPIVAILGALLQMNLQRGEDGAWKAGDLEKFAHDADLVLRAAFGSKVPKINGIRAMRDPSAPGNMNLVIEFSVPSDLRPADLESQLLAVTAALISA